MHCIAVVNKKHLICFIQKIYCSTFILLNFLHTFSSAHGYTQFLLSIIQTVMCVPGLACLQASRKMLHGRTQFCSIVLRSIPSMLPEGTCLLKMVGWKVNLYYFSFSLWRMCVIACHLSSVFSFSFGIPY